MYLQDVFTEDEYKQIVDDIQQKKIFEHKYFEFGKASFSIGMCKTKYFDLWPEGLMVSIGFDNSTSGCGHGEKPNEALDIFKTYLDACNYIHERLQRYVKPGDKYQGLKVETQMNIFDFMEE